MQRKILTPVAYLLAALADAWLLSSNQLLNEASTFETVLCVSAAILFALGAALVSRGPHVAHMCAAAGVVALPWIYRTTLQGNILLNWWIVFNVPDRELRMYNGLATAKLAILAVALIVFAIGDGDNASAAGYVIDHRNPYFSARSPESEGDKIIIWAPEHPERSLLRARVTDHGCPPITPPG